MGIGTNLVKGKLDADTQIHFMKLGLLVANAGKSEDGGWSMENFFKVLHSNGRHIEGFLENGAKMFKENAYTTKQKTRGRCSK